MDATPKQKDYNSKPAPGENNKTYRQPRPPANQRNNQEQSRNYLNQPRNCEYIPQDPNAFCTTHQAYGHHTRDCILAKHLRQQVN
jgi:hypothetical protein